MLKRRGPGDLAAQLLEPGVLTTSPRTDGGEVSTDRYQLILPDAKRADTHTDRPSCRDLTGGAPLNPGDPIDNQLGRWSRLTSPVSSQRAESVIVHKRLGRSERLWAAADEAAR